MLGAGGSVYATKVQGPWFALALEFCCPCVHMGFLWFYLFNDPVHGFL